MVEGIYLAYKYTVATSELISLPRLFVIFVWAIDFYIVVTLSGLLLPERFRQITYSIFLCAMRYFKTDHNHEGEKICTSKVIVARLVVIVPPALQIEIFRAYNRVKRKS